MTDADIGQLHETQDWWLEHGPIDAVVTSDDWQRDQAQINQDGQDELRDDREDWTDEQWAAWDALQENG